MREKEEDASALIYDYGSLQEWGIIGSYGQQMDREDAQPLCRMHGLPVPVMQIRGICYVTWRQHPCSLYCTPKSEVTASALFSPAVALSNHTNEEYAIPEHWVHFQVVQSIVALWL